MENQFSLYMDTLRNKLRISEKHNVKWVRLKDIANVLNLSDDEMMQYAYSFELNITSSVSSISSTINEEVVRDFLKFILEKKSS